MKIVSTCLGLFLALSEAVCQSAVATNAAPAFLDDGLPVIQVEFSGWSVRRRPTSGDPNANPGIQVYTDGRYSALTAGGIVSTGSVSRAQLSTLRSFFQQERILGLTNAVVEQAVERDTRRQAEQNKRASFFMRSHPIRMHLRIRTLSGVTDVERVELHQEIESHPDVWELAAIKRCVDKIFEVALGKDAKWY